MNRPKNPTLHLLGTAAGLLLAFSPLRASADAFYEAWDQIYNSTATTSQVPHAVAVDRRGNVFVTGEYFLTSGTEFYTAKYDGLDGHVVWQRFEGLGAGASFTPNAIAVDSNGDCVVTGSRNVANSIDYYTVKYSGVNGNSLWNAPATYNGPNDGEDDALKVAFDSIGNVFVTGQSVGKNAGGSTGFDITTIKYNGVTGAQIGVPDRYTASSSNFDDVPAAMVIDSNDNVIIAGRAVPASGQRRLYVRKLNNTLGVVWGIAPIDTGDEEGASGVAVDSNNNVIVTGIYRDNSSQFGYYTAKLAASNGSMIWETGTNSPVSSDTFGNPRPAPAGVSVGPDNQPVVSGTLLGQSGTRYIRTIKYTSGGSSGNAVESWSTASIDTGLDLGDTSALAVVTDGSSNTIIVGETQNQDGDLDMYIARYDAATGERTFAAIYPGSFGSTDSGVDVAADAFGNIVALGNATLNKGTGIGLKAFATFKFNRFIATVGDKLPDGIPGVADGAVYSAGNPPALSDVGSIITKATIKSGAKKTAVILAQGNSGGTTFPGVQGQPAPDENGGVVDTNPKYASFSDPIIAPNGTYAFAAKTTGPAAHANGLWTNMSGTLKRVLRQGDPLPIVPAANLSSIMSYSMKNGELVVLVKLSGPASMNTLLLRVNQNSTIFPLLRTGVSTFQLNGTGYTVKSFATLSPAKASPGDGRWEGISGVMVKAVGVQTADKKNPRDVLLRVAADGSAVAPLVYSTEAATGVDNAATYKSFGLPSIGGNGIRYAFLGALNHTPGANGISGANDSVLVYSSIGSTFNSFGREGVASNVPGISTLPYAAFTDPITNSNGAVAFTATLKGVPGTPVTASTNRALLFGNPLGTINKVIRLGDTAAVPTPIPPETAEAPTKYTSILAYALSGGSDGAPIFIAKLGGAATAKNNIGLFAVASDGVTVRRLLRTGEHLGDQTIKTISLLKTIPKAFGTARSFNSSGSVVVALTFTDHKTALLHVGIP